MVKIIFTDKTEKVVTRKRWEFIRGIKDIRKQVFTYKFV